MAYVDTVVPVIHLLGAAQMEMTQEPPLKQSVGAYLPCPSAQPLNGVICTVQSFFFFFF